MTTEDSTSPAPWWSTFLIFAGIYFVAALLRAVTATLAPEFSAEFGLRAADLGLLAGVYFLGFSALQLPLGAALDRWGPRRVELVLLALAVLGCLLFALARSFGQLVAARALIGMGVASCLMAPLTHFRRHLGVEQQLRCNSWMLMAGSLGMVGSTTPVQWLLPVWGWRGQFVALAVLLALGMVLLRRGVPAGAPGKVGGAGASGWLVEYLPIVRHPAFLRVAPLALLLYGGMVAVQALWAGPWLTRVCGWTPVEAGRGLLLLNAGMLVAFLGWGTVMPWLQRRGTSVESLLVAGVPVSLLILALNVWLVDRAQAGHWMAWCMSCSVVALSQPALANAFPPQMAGRALSAYNLLAFVGIFSLQWGVGLAVDVFQALGASDAQAFQRTFALLWLACAASYAWYVLPVWRRGDNG